MNNKLITTEVLSEIVKSRNIVQISSNIEAVQLDLYFPGIFGEECIVLDFIYQIQKPNVIHFEEFSEFMKESYTILKWLSLYKRVVIYGASLHYNTEDRVLYNNLIKRLIFASWETGTSIVTMDFTKHNNVDRFNIGTNVNKTIAVLSDYKIFITNDNNKDGSYVFHGEDHNNWMVNHIENLHTIEIVPGG